jgi:hypothetical protein
MQETIAVCVFKNNQYELETNFIIDNLKEKTNCNIKIYVCEVNDSLTESINETLSNITEDYCVFFPANAIVNVNWCEDLLFYFKNSIKPGLLGIRNCKEDLILNPILFESEELINVWKSDKNIVDGIMMFETKHLTSDFGKFEQIFDKTGFEYISFSLKFAFSGLNNFYIRKQTYFEYEMPHDILFPTKTKDGYFLIGEFIKSNIILKQ